MSSKVLMELISDDIVGEKRHQKVLRTLLSGPAGEWRHLRHLDPTGEFTAECRGYAPNLGPKVLEGLRLAWTLHPDEPPDSPACLILFFHGRDSAMWQRMARLDRSTL